MITRIYRNKGDALYRHLPGSLTDFSDGRVIARTSRWSSTKADLKGRRRVVERFHGGFIRFADTDPTFPQKPDVNRYGFFEPNTISLELFPLTVQFENPDHNLKFITIQDLNSYLIRTGKFDQRLIQRDLIHVSTKGGMESLQVPECPEHSRRQVVLDTSSGSMRQFLWRCSLCHRTLGEIAGFVEGEWVVGARPVRSASAFVPQIVTLVNIGSDLEDIGTSAHRDPLIVAKYMQFVDATLDLQLAMTELASSRGPATSQEIEAFVKGLGVSQELVGPIIEKWEKEKKTPQERAISKVTEVFPNVLEKGSTVSSVYEFLELLRGRILSMSTLLSESEGSTKWMYSTFMKELASIGISVAHHVSSVPLIQAAYGYTRGDFDPRKCILRAFPPDGMDAESKIPIYVNKTESEGILLEFDRSRILDWFESNAVIDKETTKGFSELDRKIWFLENVGPATTISGTGASIIDKELFFLLHTISHALIKSVTIPSGIGSESMGELFFMNVPAVLLYSREGGFKTGGLEDLFKHGVLTWLEIMHERLSNCVYDPVCLTTQASCHYCLMTSEATCSHFNSSLSRRILFGWKDHNKTGFWEIPS